MWLDSKETAWLCTTALFSFLSSRFICCCEICPNTNTYKEAAKLSNPIEPQVLQCRLQKKLENTGARGWWILFSATLQLQWLWHPHRKHNFTIDPNGWTNKWPLNLEEESWWITVWHMNSMGIPWNIKPPKSSVKRMPQKEVPIPIKNSAQELQAWNKTATCPLQLHGRFFLEKYGTTWSQEPSKLWGSSCKFETHQDGIDTSYTIVSST